MAVDELTQVRERTLQVLLLEQRARELDRLTQRFELLQKYPDQITQEDFDRLIDSPEVLRRELLSSSAEIRDRYAEYQDKSVDIADTMLGFLRQAWEHAGIDMPFAENWHHRLQCEECEDLAAGRRLRTIFNQPPGTTKSLIFGTFFPAWRWAVAPSESFLYISYSEEVPSNCADNLRTLINSVWFQRRWGNSFRLTTDNKLELRNSAGGRWKGVGIKGGITGGHPKYVIMDDPQKGQQIFSEKEMSQAVQSYASAISTRGMLKNSRHIVVMQRLSAADFTNVLLQQNETLDDPSLKWHLVCLPMHYRPDSDRIHPNDPRTEEGELLWPEMLDEQQIKRIVSSLELEGVGNVEAQLEQHPDEVLSPILGDAVGQFFVPTSEVPREIQQGRAVRGWDMAGTEGGGDWTVGVLVVEMPDGSKWLLDMIRVQKDATNFKPLVCRVAQDDAARFPNYRVATEVQPGPAGKVLQQDIAVSLGKLGVHCSGQPATRHKVIRASPFLNSVRYGGYRFLDDKPWSVVYRKALVRFPGEPDDEVDASGHAHNALVDWNLGLL